MTSAPFTGARQPLRIAYITKTPLPSSDAATIQIIQTAAALTRAGASLDLFFPMGEGERRLPLDALHARLAEYYGAELGFGLRQLRNTSRALHAVKAGLAVANDGYDILHTRDVQNVLLGLATGCRVVYESYRTPEGNTPIIKSLLRRAFRHPRFLGQIIHSRFARERHLEAGYPEQKLRTIYNGFDPAAFATERSPAEARRLLGLPERVTVVYAGRIAPLKRIDLLLGAAQATPELSWVLAGANQSAEARPFAAQGATIPNVSFLGYLPGPALTPALQAADILVIPPSAEPLERYGTTVMPLKVFQYLAAGRPLVVGDVADTAELLEDGTACLRVAPDRLEDFVVAVRALAADPERRERMGSVARALAHELTWDARARQIIDYLNERLGAIGYR